MAQSGSAPSRLRRRVRARRGWRLIRPDHKAMVRGGDPTRLAVRLFLARQRKKGISARALMPGPTCVVGPGGAGQEECALRGINTTP